MTIESLPAKCPDRIVLWSRGASPHWYFVAAKSERPDIEGSPVYETLDPIVLKGSPEALATQPKDGELPELPMHKGFLNLHNTGGVSQVHGYTAEQMRAYGERCRTLASRRVVVTEAKVFRAADELCRHWNLHYPDAVRMAKAALTAALQPDSGEG